MEKILKIAIKDIENSPYQGRLFEITGQIEKQDKQLIDELKQSILENGLIQAIQLRHSPLNKGKYEIIDGHRRVIASKQLGETNIKAIVKELDDKQAQLQSVIGNLQRKNLSAIENAFAFKKILNTGVFASQSDLSKALGKDSTYVGDVLNVLKMDTRIINDLLENKTINDVRLLRSIRNAKPLIAPKTENNEQYQLYKLVIEKKFTRKQLYNYLETKKAEAIIDNNNLEADKTKLNDTTYRQNILKTAKTQRLKRQVNKRNIKASFDLSGLNKKDAEKLKKQIEQWMDEIESKMTR